MPLFDGLKLDDPVGALSVHLVNGVFGTLCIGLFAQSHASFDFMPAGCAVSKDGLFFGGGMEQLVSQFWAVGITALMTFPLSLAAWAVLEFSMGIRVNQKEEMEGLDIGEHNQEAYPDFAPALSKN